MSTAPAPTAHCHRCSAGLAASVAHGLCPRCLARSLFGELPELPRPTAQSIPHQLGDYELQEVLARGGMGVVYRARQRSLRREVAVKVLLHPAFADPSERARFEMEAQAVASLQHPHIVSIYEVGEAEGHSFFAMELVDGPDLASLTRSGPLPPARAAQLVSLVADAIQHAHDRGILHRDLKPSNVLVDLAGFPRVTDFGLAKRIDASRSHPIPGLDLTLTGQVLGTPGYLAPEQATARSAIGPTTDVYGLGALLYHLLTARAPFTGDTAIAILRQVEENPPVAPRLLNPAIPTDLENICLKAIAKAPHARYPTARALAEDLRRFLDGKPVVARAIRPSERLGRWCRQRPALASALAIIALLLGGIAIASQITVRRLEHSARLTEAARARATHISAFLKQALTSADPSAEGRDVRVIDLLEQAAQRAERELSGLPDVLGEILQTIGVTYYNLSRYDAAEPLLLKAKALFSRQPGIDSAAYGRVLTDLGNLYYWQGDYPKAQATLTNAVATLRPHAATDEAALAEALYSLGMADSQHGHDELAEPHLQEAIVRANHALGVTNLTSASALHQLGMNHGTAGDDEAERRYYQEALQRFRALPGTETDQATISANLGGSLSIAGRPAEAEPLLRESLALRQHLFGERSTPVAISLAKLASVLAHLQRGPEAEQLARNALAIQSELLPAGHRDRIGSLTALGDALAAQNRLAEAERHFRDAHALTLALYPPEHWIASQLDRILGDNLRAQGRVSEALPLLQRAHTHLLAQFGPAYPMVRRAAKSLEELTATPSFHQPIPPPVTKRHQ